MGWLGWIKVVSPVNGRTSYQQNGGSKVSQKRHLRRDEVENGIDKILFSKVKKKNDGDADSLPSTSARASNQTVIDSDTPLPVTFPEISSSRQVIVRYTPG